MAPRFSVGLGSAGVTQPVGNKAQVGASVRPLQGQVGVNAGVQVGGTSSVGVGAGFDPSKGTVGFSPKIQIGDSEEAKIGGTVGGLAGSVVGGPLGSAAGSAAGSAVGNAINKDPKAAAVGMAVGGTVGAAVAPKVANMGEKALGGAGKALGVKSGKNKEHKKRDSFRNQLIQAGVFTEDGAMQLPDGTTANFFQDAKEGSHSWKNPGKRVDKSGDRDLYAYETDYTNDTDYVASMGGISLARLIGGGKDKEIDQTGQQIGNQALGKVGYGADFTQDNFKSVMANMRAVYADKGGIKTKEEMLSLASKAYSENRINEADLAVMNQTARMMFDNDYGLASKLMQGRWPGIETANKTPGNTNYTGGAPVYTPGVTSPEVLSSFQRYIELFQMGKNMAGGGSSKSGSGNSLAAALAIAAGVYKTGIFGDGTDAKDAKAGTKAGTQKPAEGGGLGALLGGIIKSGASGLRDLYDDVIGSDSGAGDFELDGGNIFETNDAYDTAGDVFGGNLSGASNLDFDLGDGGFTY